MALTGPQTPLTVCIDIQDAEPQNLEPDKCSGWQWVQWPSEVPRPAFQGLHQLLKAGYDPWASSAEPPHGS